MNRRHILPVYKTMMLCITAVLLTLSGMVSHTAYAATDTEDIVIQIGKNKEIVEPLKGSFMEKNGNKYFLKENGKRAKNLFFAKGKNVYYVDDKGEVPHGWKKIKKHYYFFGRKTGKLVYDTKVDRIKVTKKGIAKETTANLAIVKVYLKAQNVVQTVSNPSDTKSQKLYKCYLWMKKFPYRQYRTLKTARSSHPNDWDLVFANDIFNTHAGCCASEACAFAYIAKVCGYKNVSICTDTEHAWVDIGGKLYDPLFAEAKSFSKNYNANYTDYRIHPGYKKTI